MSYDAIILEKKENIATITLNRPEKLNAISEGMREELLSALADVNDDDEVRVLVITGAGRGFCSGADVGGTERDASPPKAEDSRRDIIGGWAKIILGLQKMEKPTIAMVNGVAAGAGCDIALACDIRVGSDNARFGNIFVNRGLIASDGGCWLYPRVMGLGKALEFCFTGDFIEAREADKIGILNYLVKAEELDNKTMTLARKIAQGPPIAIRLMKQLIYRGLETDLETSQHLSAAYMTIASSTEDSREAGKALTEKRQPKFNGK